MGWGIRWGMGGGGGVCTITNLISSRYPRCLQIGRQVSPFLLMSAAVGVGVGVSAVSADSSADGDHPVLRLLFNDPFGSMFAFVSICNLFFSYFLRIICLVQTLNCL